MVTYKKINMAAANEELQFQVLNNQGAIAMEQRDPTTACDYFKQALAVKPDKVDTIHNLATGLKGIGKFAEALTYFDKCVAEQPEFYSALCGRIEVLNSLSRFAEAVEAANAAIKIKPDEFRAYADRGFSNLKQQKVDEAIVDFEMAMEHGSRSSADLMKVYALAVSLKGDKLLNSQQFAEAASTYEKALSIASSEEPPAPMLFNYSLSLLHSGRKEEAMVNMKHTVEIAPNFFNAWAAMGLSYLQDQKYESCIEALTQAIRIKPDEVEVQYHLGVAYLKSNKLVDAVEQFRGCLRVKPDHEAAQKALAAVEASIAYANRDTTPPPPPPGPPVISKRASFDEVAAATPDPPPPVVENTAEEEQLQADFTNLDIVETNLMAETKKMRTQTADAETIHDDDINAAMNGQGEAFVTMEFPLEQLTYPGPYPKGCRVERREQYLPDDLFLEMFKMTKDEFYLMRKWRQMAKKKECGMW